MQGSGTIRDIAVSRVSGLDTTEGGSIRLLCSYKDWVFSSLQTLKLRECMLEHKDYYAPLLEEEERLEKDIALQSGSQHEEEQADSS